MPVLGFTRATTADAHFAACRATYLDLLGRVGIRPGDSVLDAGCGTGSFLPALTGLVGPDGRVTGLDLVRENVEQAAHRTAALPCPVDVDRGSVLSLPYPDGSFDVAWCANLTQCLGDGELRTALAELRRVVRTGGLVAVKDLDATLVTVRPGDPFLLTDFFRAAGATPGYAARLLRTRDLYRWLREAGLADVVQSTVLSEHVAPLSAEELAYYGPSFASAATRAPALGVPGAWEPLLDPADHRNPLRSQDTYVSEGNVLAVGRVG
ncbi:class I SAM-dependent methyltransferase [Actinophytocola oryzae]|uniref:Ubiquinone/menaquinone biosynthesis C-methylase UbiE n=1 Tax=Actinophytocola oryzae TaxID=502181 RepID=A0A4R7VX65_9PSEU|nr:methyltransferase domain-containing protein [Actinophytocola oryzae]TDV54245.1 ubiquinone/menaquinone biosynthesis C-methylase UbiE [Actinophytocola oryzae]